MKVGQKAFFYHSNTKPPGIIGIVEVSVVANTDPSNRLLYNCQLMRSFM